MDPMLERILKVILAMAAVYGGLGLGYAARRRRPEISASSAGMLRNVLLWLDVPLIFLTFWALAPKDRDSLWRMPLAGLCLSLAMLPIGWALSRLHRMEPRRAGVMLGASALSNVGLTYGGLLALVFLGVRGVTISQSYTIFYSPFTFVVMFQVAAWFAGRQERQTWREWGMGFLGNPARSWPIAAIGLAILLNLWAPRPPGWIEFVLSAMVYVSTAAYSFAIGASLSITDVRQNLRPCLSLCAAKFILSPLIGLALAWAFAMDDAQRQVMFIQSIMPVAIWSVVVAGLTGLDLKLANAVWIVTTLGALPLVPLIWWVISRIGGS